MNADKMPELPWYVKGEFKVLGRQECWGRFTMCDLHTHSPVMLRKNTQKLFLSLRH